MEKRVPKDGFVYRVSTSGEWEELQRTGATLGGSLDRRTGCIHLSDLDQVGTAEPENSQKVKQRDLIVSFSFRC